MWLPVAALNTDFARHEGTSSSELLDLQPIVTGMHLSPEFGLTVKEIEKMAFELTEKLRCY